MGKREIIPYMSFNDESKDYYAKCAQEHGLDNTKIGKYIFIIRMIKSLLFGLLAMYCPLSKYAIKLHQARGVDISSLAFIGKGVTIDWIYPEYIHIMEGASLAGNNTLIAHSKPSQKKSRFFRAYRGHIIVEKDAWVCIGAIILPGITIGEGSVVSAGSVVTVDVPPYTVVRGNPAKIVARVPK